MTIPGFDNKALSISRIGTTKPVTVTRVLLLEDEDIFRQAIVFNVDFLFDDAEIFGVNRSDELKVEIDKHNGLRMDQFDLAILDPGVPPVSPPCSKTAFLERIEMISWVVSLLRSDCLILILTGSYEEAEAKVMLDMGASKYLSKGNLDLMQLRHHIHNPDADTLVGPDGQPRTERFFSNLTEKERIGWAVHQKIYDEDEVADALGLDLDTIRKYVTRAKKRHRSRSY